MVILDVNPFVASSSQYDEEFEDLNDTKEDVMNTTVSPVMKSAFRCGKCLYQSHSRELFSRHVNRHSTDRPFECTVCDQSFSDHSEFVSHLVLHQQSEEIQCPFCPCKSRASVMEFHMLNHRGVELFDCPECEFSTNNRKALNRHIDIDHNPILKCEYCKPSSLERMTKQSLLKHLDEVHAIREVKTEPVDGCACYSEVVKSEPLEDPECLISNGCGVQSMDLSNGTGNDGDLTYDCRACEFSSPLKVVLKVHNLRMHLTKTSCQHCSAVMTKHALIQHLKNKHRIGMFLDGKGIRNYGSPSKNRPNKRPHSKVPKPESPHRESEIAPNAVSYETLPVTNDGGILGEQGASGVKPYRCSLCGFSSHVECSLKYHMKFMHTVKYHCNHCPAIMSKYDIIKHSSDDHGVQVPTRGPSGLRVALESECKGDRLNVDSEQFAGDTKSVHSAQNGDDKVNSLFSCTVCDFVSKSNSCLLKHADMFHGKRYRCPHCPAIMTKHELIDHGWKSHRVLIKAKNRFLEAVGQECDPDGNVGCSDREDAECEPEQAVTEQDHTSKAACSYCGYISTTSYRIKSHIDRMHRINYQCWHCSAVMPKFDLIQHCKSVHDVVICSKGHIFKKAEVSDENPVVKTEPNSLKQVDNDVQADRSDLPSSKKDTCPSCGYVGNRYHMESHVERMHSRKYRCDVCSEVMTKHDLIKHYENLHGIVINRRGVGKGFLPAPSEASNDEIGNASSACLSNGNQDAQEPSMGDIGADFKHCSVCNFSTKISGNLGSHMEKFHHRKYVCLYCPAVMTKHEIIEHCKDVHSVILPKVGRRIQSLKPAEQVESEETDFNQNPVPAGSEFDATAVEGSSKCDQCSFSTPHRKSMLNHVMNLHSKKYACNDCSDVMTKYELIIHSKNTHGVEIPLNGRGYVFKHVPEDSNEDLQAGFSGASSNTKSVGRRSDPHSGISPNYASQLVEDDGTIRHKCSDCDFTSVYPSNVKAHFENLHQSLFHCMVCPVIMTKFELKKHVEDEHGVRVGTRAQFRAYVPDSGNGKTSESVPEPSSTESVGGFVLQDGGCFRCAECDYSSSYRKLVVKHLLSLHTKKYSCNRCSVVLPKYNMLRHYGTEHGIEIPCKSIAVQYFTLVDSMSSESTAAVTSDVDDAPAEELEPVVPADEGQPTDSKSLVCKICGFPSKYEKSMELHMNNYHKRKFACDHCQAVLTKHSLIQHCLDVHGVVVSGRNPHLREVTESSGGDGGPSSTQLSPGPSNGVTVFQCSACDFTAKLRMHLNVHTKVMHNEKHNCTVCSKVMTKYDLLNHFRNDHVDSPQSDSVVPKGSTEGDDVPDAEAMQARNTFRCEECAFSAKSKWHLKYHMKKNHWTKYHCPHCSTILTKHELIQHGKNVHSILFSSRHSFDEAKGATIFSSASAQGNNESQSIQSTPTTSATRNSVESQAEDEVKTRCSHCDHSTMHKWSMTEHVESFHKKKYLCSMCSEVMTRHELCEHSKERHGVVLKRSGKLPSAFKPFSEAAKSKYESKPLQQTPVEAIQSHAFQPVVFLERL